MRINKQEMPIIPAKQLEDLKAENEDLKATCAYLSMMSGIDIPSEEDPGMPESTGKEHE